MAVKKENQNDVMIHDIIDSIQTSIDIADQASRKKYNFAVAQMDIKMTLDFELKADKSKSTTSKGGPKHRLNLFSRKNDPILNSANDDSGDRHASMTLSMKFKPGGKAFENTTTDSDSTDNEESSVSSDDDDSLDEDDL